MVRNKKQIEESVHGYSFSKRKLIFQKNSPAKPRLGMLILQVLNGFPITNLPLK